MFFRMFVLVAVIAIVNCGDRNDLVSRYIFIIILNKNSSILILKYFDEILLNKEIFKAWNNSKMSRKSSIMLW